MPIFRNPSLLSRRAVGVRIAVGTAMVASMLAMTSPVSATMAGGASGGNGSQTHVGTLSGGCAEYHSFYAKTTFIGGTFHQPGVQGLEH